MPTMVVCHRHNTLVPTGGRCPRCGGSSPVERARRQRNNLELGRGTAHWRRLSASARHRERGVCPGCGRAETESDAGSKLTADLPGGGDHAKARLQDVRVLCRRCHGRVDGGKPARR